MGAAGRDFHNFNIVYRNDPTAEVVAFTAAQIPGIAGRNYPAILAGSRYPNGIPIVEESRLEALCRQHAVDEIVFAYSDITHEHVMHAASRTLAMGADFVLLGPKSTMLTSRQPVIAVTAVRTGAGKSPICRWIARYLKEKGIKAVVVRHPMAYGDLRRQRVQRFSSFPDLEQAACTNEEREEYEPYVAIGVPVFSGIDCPEILTSAEKEAQVILWDGGNNDFPFIRPDLTFTLVDALRPHQIDRYHPGEAVLRMADVIVITKTDAARFSDIEALESEIGGLNPHAPIMRSASIITIDDGARIRGRRVLVVEDGPTLTHGGMAYGAGYVAACREGVEIVDPRESATPEIMDIYEQYPHIGPVLPAIGYSQEQLAGLKDTIDRSRAEVIVIGTPFDFARHVKITKPAVRVTYEFADAGEPRLATMIDNFLLTHNLR